MNIDKKLLRSPEATLVLFNEKLARLRKGRFVRSLNRTGYRMEISFKVGRPLKVKRTGPDDDAIQALVLNLRFFLQDNEPCSIRNLSRIYSDSRIPTDIQEKFSEARQTLNKFLDSESDVRIRLGDEKMTLRKITDAAVYGDLAHSNTQQANRYRKLFGNPLISPISHSDLMDSFIALVKIAFYIGSLNQKVLDNRWLR